MSSPTRLLLRRNSNIVLLDLANIAATVASLPLLVLRSPSTDKTEIVRKNLRFSLRVAQLYPHGLSAGLGFVTVLGIASRLCDRTPRLVVSAGFARFGRSTELRSLRRNLQSGEFVPTAFAPLELIGDRRAGYEAQELSQHEGACRQLVSLRPTPPASELQFLTDRPYLVVSFGFAVIREERR